MAEDATVALITSTVAKSFLKIASGEDTIIDALVNSCSKLAATYCGRPTFRKATYTEYYDGNGKDSMLLRQFPVNSVTSLYNADATRTFDANTAVDVSADVLIDKNAGGLRLWNNGGVFLLGKANVKVVYVAGYAIGATGAEIEVPYDLVDAAKLMVMYAYKRHYQDQRIGLASETIGERVMSYSDQDIPTKAKAILDQYKNFGGVPGFSHAD